ncbi:MAG: hypothetical protein LBC92_04530, partial [Rickettsiales bacterium]|nr:hypothetical protein [Rickettsiales bacterium]
MDSTVKPKIHYTYTFCTKIKELMKEEEIKNPSKYQNKGSCYLFDDGELKISYTYHEVISLRLQQFENAINQVRESYDLNLDSQEEIIYKQFCDKNTTSIQSLKDNYLKSTGTPYGKDNSLQKDVSESETS